MSTSICQPRPTLKTRPPAARESVELGRLGLNEHLSSQRSNGLRAMIERVRETAMAQA